MGSKDKRKGKTKKRKAKERRERAAVRRERGSRVPRCSGLFSFLGRVALIAVVVFVIPWIAVLVAFLHYFLVELFV